MTEDEILKRADDVAAAIKGQSQRIEDLRRLPDDIADVIKASDLTRLFVPKKFGGMEAHPVTAFKAFEKVAAADASAGWCLGIVASPGINAAYMDDDVAQHFYGTPGAWMAGVFAPNGKAVRQGDSYKVNGRWSWGSGTQNADYVMGGSFVMGDDGKPQPPVVSRLMIVPRAQIKFHDTWHVSGLKGTGSTDFEMVDLDVPVNHSVSLQADPRRLDAPLYVFPSFAMLATGIAATALGVGQAALEAFHDLAGAKTPQFSKRSLAAKPAAQVDYAKAVGLIEGGRAFAYDAAYAAYEQAAAEGELPDEVRARLRLAFTTAVRNTAEAVSLLYVAGGGSSLFQSSPLQRHFRDIHAITQHIMVNGATQELTGRVLLGVETDTAML